MCERKPSQVFLLGDPAGGAGGAIAGQLMSGAGVLTDLVTDVLPSAATTLTLKDGSGPSGRVILVAVPATRAPAFSGGNLEFENGLFYELAGAGPNFGTYTLAAYLADDSPDPLGIQMERLREAVTGLTSRVAALVDGLLHGDPAA